MPVATGGAERELESTAGPYNFSTLGPGAGVGLPFWIINSFSPKACLENGSATR